MWITIAPFVTRNIHGGTGIMVDDIIAGVVAAAVIFVIGHYWPL